jgi:hypothetical protein
MMNFLKIFKILSVILPLPVYLFLSATLFSIEPTHIIQNAEIDEISLYTFEDEYFIYTDNQEAILGGVVTYNPVLGKYGFEIDKDSIVRVGYKFYGLEDDNLIDIKQFEIEKRQSYAFPLSFFITLASVLIVVLITQRKMQWHKKYPLLAVTLALLTGYVILLIIDTMVGDIKNVFLIAWISSSIYGISQLLENNIISSRQSSQLQSAILEDLVKRNA